MRDFCKWKILPPAYRFRDEGGVERHLAGGANFGFNKMVRGRSTPVVFGGHFHVTRFGMFRSRAGLALNPWSTAASPRTAYRHRPYLHTQGVIRTAPPSRSRVKNDYSIIGMLSREIIPLPLLGGVGCSLRKRTPPCLRFAQTSLPTRGRERKAFAGMTME
jgi:hypothetical protein